ncbi:MAG: enoyl-CoA hydratase/isomerase family protein [Proteobacteria bacterium]|nr:enoyl-CoA hydratase/isomerase family protein [Pseudomonadota bacterium]
MYESFEVEREGGILWLKLNRPERLNAISRQMIGELNAFFRELPEDHDARVVVMRGAGRAFCAGADLKEGAEMEPESVPELLRVQRALSQITIMMQRAPQPIIAMLHGAVSGGGFVFALAADLRIAGETTRMNAAPIRIGLSGCEMGTSFLLPRIVGQSTAAEMLLTGSFVDAERAERIGLVSRVVPDAELEEEARQLAQDMLRNTSLGLKLTKEGLNLGAPSLEAAVAMDDRSQILCVQTEDSREAIDAFSEKREPHYRDR